MLAETVKSCRGRLFPDVYVHLNVLDLSPSNTFSLRIVNKNISRIFSGEIALLILSPVSVSVSRTNEQLKPGSSRQWFSAVSAGIDHPLKQAQTHLQDY